MSRNSRDAGADVLSSDDAALTEEEEAKREEARRNKACLEPVRQWREQIDQLTRVAKEPPAAGPDVYYDFTADAPPTHPDSRDLESRLAVASRRYVFADPKRAKAICDLVQCDARWLGDPLVVEAVTRARCLIRRARFAPSPQDPWYEDDAEDESAPISRSSIAAYEAYDRRMTGNLDQELVERACAFLSALGDSIPLHPGRGAKRFQTDPSSVFEDYEEQRGLVEEFAALVLERRENNRPMSKPEAEWWAEQRGIEPAAFERSWNALRSARGKGAVREAALAGAASRWGVSLSTVRDAVAEFAPTPSDEER